jgi:hypothetical protein
MKSNRDLLKEAIADAKAVKETAIANAKAALEENFGPLIREKLAAKIAEMDLEEDELEEVEEMKEEAYMEESDDMVAEDDTMGGDGTMEEIDLEELLRELDGLEEEESIMEGDELINDPKGATAHGNVSEEEEGYEDEDADGIEDSEDDEVDLENMSEDDLRKFIEDVIANMVASGELEGNVEGEEEEVEFEDEDEMMEENIFSKIGSAFKVNNFQNYLIDKKGVDAATAKKLIGNLDKNPNDESARAELLKYIQKDDLNDFTIYINDKKKGLTGLPARDAVDMFSAVVKDTKFTPRAAKSAGTVATGFAEAKKVKAELNEALKTITTLRSELNEINLLNAKLLYVNKIFRAKNLTEAQKVKVLEAFDKTSTPKEAKLVFETLSEGLKEKRSNVNESIIGGASKVAGIAPKKPILEVDNQFARWQVLAGIK